MAKKREGRPPFWVALLLVLVAGLFVAGAYFGVYKFLAAAFTRSIQQMMP